MTRDDTTSGQRYINKLAVTIKPMKAVLCSLALALVTSCAKGPPLATTPSIAKVDTLAIWRAPESSISNRLDAARQLLSIGMNSHDVESVLGDPTQRNRHNPMLLAGTPRDKHRRVRWWYDYRFPEGIISVYFLQVMDAARFEAEYQSVSIGNEPESIKAAMIEIEEQPTELSTSPE